MKLLATLAILVVLGVVADVVAENVAEKSLSERLATSLDGADTVDVEVQGRPFLLQGARGDFQALDIDLGSVRRQGVAVQDVELTLREVEFSVGEFLDGNGRITVGGGDGRGAVSQRSLNVALREEGVGATVVLSGGRASVAVGGVKTAVDSVAVADGGLEFTAPDVGGLRLTLPDLLPSRERVRYTDARVEGGRVVLLFEFPPTSFSPGSL